MCDQGMHKAPMHTPAAPQTAAFRHSGRMPRSGRLSTADGLPLGVEIEYQICCTGHAWSTDGGGVAHASPVRHEANRCSPMLAERGQLLPDAGSWHTPVTVGTPNRLASPRRG
jgi:hypothetical protein